jgi:hypothetical protein
LPDGLDPIATLLPGWAVAMTKPAVEDVAERAIRRAGYRVYLPRFRKICAGIGPRAAARSSWAHCSLATSSRSCTPAKASAGIATATGVALDAIRAAVDAGGFDQARPAAVGKPPQRFDLHAGDRVQVGSGMIGDSSGWTKTAGLTCCWIY